MEGLPTLNGSCSSIGREVVLQEVEATRQIVKLFSTGGLKVVGVFETGRK